MIYINEHHYSKQNIGVMWSENEIERSIDILLYRIEENQKLMRDALDKYKEQKNTGPINTEKLIDKINSLARIVYQIEKKDEEF